jgi:hypothetical protein
LGDTLKDHTRRRFGKITVAWPVGYVGKKPRPSWLAFCDCGIFFVVRAANLSGNRTQSCGCARKETLARVNFKHGHSVRGLMSPEYHAWANAIQRCSNLEDTCYGGRGIKVCDRWLGSFELFLEDMGPRPKGSHGLRSEYSIERRDVNGNYDPENCYWATIAEQNANKRVKRKIS